VSHANKRFIKPSKLLIRVQITWARAQKILLKTKTIEILRAPANYLVLRTIDLVRNEMIRIVMARLATRPHGEERRAAARLEP